MRSRIQPLARRLSKEVTRRIGLYRGERFPFYYVSEHPKSGGSWLARMVSDYLQLPLPKYSLLPLTFSCVILNHWPHDPRMRRVFYLYRDGRDVMVSYYFHHFHMARNAHNPVPEWVGRTYRKVFGDNFDPADVVGNMPRFIEHEFANPGRGTPLNWREHLESWFNARPGTVTYVSYEDLKRDCAGTLAKALEGVLEQEIDSWLLETTVEKMSMERQTGRKPGEADPRQHARKGIVGDWKNHFSREAAEVFNDLAGSTLVELGYESDKGWVDRYDPPAG